MTDAAARRRRDAGAGTEEPGPRVFVSGRGGADAARGLSSRARRLLVNLLLAKAAVDLLFVCALAAGSHYAAFRPSFRGSLDHADAGSVRGWVMDRAEPNRRVEVQLYLDGRLAASAEASEPRPDVAARGYAPDDRHGFDFRLEPLAPGEHEARVYAVHASAGGRRRTLQQIGPAMKFVVGETR